MTIKNKTVKFISGLLIVLIILPSVLFSAPKQVVAAAPVTVVSSSSDIWGWLSESFEGITSSASTTIASISIKDVAIDIGKELLKMAAKQILAKMTQATINWINSDFHGAPLFLENPDSFFRDIAKSELRTIVDIFGYNDLLYPFGREFALSAINAYKRQLADNAAYTLSIVVDSAKYRGNFNYGGWNGFLINTQYPQNNYLGFNLIATEKLAKALRGTVQSAADRQLTLLQQGMGFLSPQTCPSNPSYNNGINEFQKPSFQYNVPYPPAIPEKDENGNVISGVFTDDPVANKTWEQNKAKAQAEWEKKNTCPKGLVSTTPGSVAANQIFNALDTPRLTTALDGALGNSLAAIFDALISHFLEKGLNSLASKINPEPSTDNWSYNGTTLSGSADTAGTLNIPQNVSITVGQTTSTVISGGTGSYSIQPQTSASRAIATASIDVSSSSGNKLKITAGNTPGTTSVTVQDSSTPVQTVTVTITVNAIGALAVNPANIVTDANTDHQVIATISGGNGDYSKKTSPNQSIAIAIVSGTNLIVTGIERGTTFVEIKDSGTPIKTVRVTITVSGPDDLVITPSNVAIKTGEVSSIPISSGTPPYVVTNQQNISVATAEIALSTPTMLTITGRAPGTTSVIIRDSSNPFRTTTVVITATAPQGNCNTVVNGLQTNQQTDQVTCDANGGQWTVNPIP